MWQKILLNGFLNFFTFVNNTSFLGKKTEVMFHESLLYEMAEYLFKLQWTLSFVVGEFRVLL